MEHPRKIRYGTSAEDPLWNIRGRPVTEHPRKTRYGTYAEDPLRNIHGRSSTEDPRMFRARTSGCHAFLTRAGPSTYFRVRSIRGLPCMEHPRTSMHGTSTDVPCPDFRVSRFFDPRRTIRRFPGMEHPRISVHGTSTDVPSLIKKALHPEVREVVPRGYGCSAPEIFRTSGGSSVVWWVSFSRAKNQAHIFNVYIC